MLTLLASVRLIGNDVDVQCCVVCEIYWNYCTHNVKVPALSEAWAEDPVATTTTIIIILQYLYRGAAGFRL